MAEEPRCACCRRQPVEARWRPFCSERCKMADLGRWLRGDYRIPGPTVDPTVDATDGEPDPASEP